MKWRRKKTRLSHSPDRPSWWSYCSFPGNMEPGNRADLLVDGPMAYDAMLEAIRGARKTVMMDSYIFNDDSAGRRFSSALREAAKRGVLTYLIVDGVGTLHVPSEFFEAMEADGVHVLVYRSPAPWRRSFGILRRNHRKMLAVDGAVGFAGGLNIGAEWLPSDEGGLGWHDIHVRIEGPAVRELVRLAISTWHVHGGVILDPKVFMPRVESRGDELVSIIGSRERKNRKTIRRSYLKAIREAKKYIYIANAYFLPDLGFRRALGNACRRGVDVRVMVPMRGDILPVQLASQSLFGRLLRQGIRIFRWKEAVLHAKTATIDGEWATVGSFNIDHRSWRMNLEVNVNAVGPKLSEHLREVFLRDQSSSEELRLASWRRRPLILKFLERFCFLFRKLM
jgi:cardiolipin synthase A/B